MTISQVETVMNNTFKEALGIKNSGLKPGRGPLGENLPIYLSKFGLFQLAYEGESLRVYLGGEFLISICDGIKSDQNVCDGIKSDQNVCDGIKSNQNVCDGIKSDQNGSYYIDNFDVLVSFCFELSQGAKILGQTETECRGLVNRDMLERIKFPGDKDPNLEEFDEAIIKIMTQESPFYSELSVLVGEDANRKVAKVVFCDGDKVTYFVEGGKMCFTFEFSDTRITHEIDAGNSSAFVNCEQVDVAELNLFVRAIIEKLGGQDRQRRQFIRSRRTTKVDVKS